MAQYGTYQYNREVAVVSEIVIGLIRLGSFDVILLAVILLDNFINCNELCENQFKINFRLNYSVQRLF